LPGLDPSFSFWQSCHKARVILALQVLQVRVFGMVMVYISDPTTLMLWHYLCLFYFFFFLASSTRTTVKIILPLIHEFVTHDAVNSAPFHIQSLTRNAAVFWI
jgi:hypothetical protein